MYEIIVGNVGTVYHGSDKEKAIAEFENYVHISKNSEGSRAYGEDVTVFEHRENCSDIVMEHIEHLFPYDDNYIIN